MHSLRVNSMLVPNDTNLEERITQTVWLSGSLWDQGKEDIFRSSFKIQTPILGITQTAALDRSTSRSISMVGYGKFFEKGFISESKFLNESTPSGQKILPKVPL